MQKTVSGTLQIVVEEIDSKAEYSRIKVNLLNRKGEVIWTDYRNLRVGDSFNLMGATFGLTFEEG